MPWASISESVQGCVGVEVYAAGNKRPKDAVEEVGVAEQKVVAGRNRHCALDGALDPTLADGHRAVGDAPNQLRGLQGASILARRTSEIVERVQSSTDQVQRAV